MNIFKIGSNYCCVFIPFLIVFFCLCEVHSSVVEYKYSDNSMCCNSCGLCCTTLCRIAGFIKQVYIVLFLLCVVLGCMGWIEIYFSIFTWFLEFYTCCCLDLSQGLTSSNKLVVYSVLLLCALRWRDFFFFFL